MKASFLLEGEFRSGLLCASGTQSEDGKDEEMNGKGGVNEGLWEVLRFGGQKQESYELGYLGNAWGKRGTKVCQLQPSALESDYLGLIPDPLFSDCVTQALCAAVSCSVK